jgi:SAM-dependent methyltransferase
MHNILLNFLRGGRRLHDLLYDLSLNVRTSKKVSRKDNISLNRDASECVPTSYFLLRMIFTKLSVKSTDVFSDYGCGTGRAVCFAARFPFRKVYGIELHEDIAAIAETNSRKLRNPKADIEILAGYDVLNFDPKDVTQFFYFNPFGDATMSGVLGKMHSSLFESPRRIMIIYFNPQQALVLKKCQWLKERTDLSFETSGGHQALFYENSVCDESLSVDERVKRPEKRRGIVAHI